MNIINDNDDHYQQLPLDTILHIYSYLSLNITNYVYLVQTHAEAEQDSSSSSQLWHRRDVILRFMFGYSTLHDYKRTIYKLYRHVVLERASVTSNEQSNQLAMCDPYIFTRLGLMNPYVFITEYCQDMDNEVFDGEWESSQFIARSSKYLDKVYLGCSNEYFQSDSKELHTIQIRPDPLVADSTVTAILEKYGATLLCVISNYFASGFLTSASLLKNQLKYLHLSMTELEDEHLAIIGNQFPLLQKLTVSYNMLTLCDDALDDTVFPNVTDLSISSNDLSDSGAQRLSQMFPKLTSLSISLYSDAIVHAVFTSETILNLEIVGGIDDDFPSYKYLQDNRVLKQIDVGYDEDLSSHFGKYLSRNSFITDISLESSRFSKAILNKNCNLPIRRLSCMDDAVVTHLRLSTKLLTIQKLCVPSSQRGSFYLLMQNLQYLHLTGFQISHYECIRHLECRKHLEVVTDRVMSIGDASRLCTISNIVKITFDEAIPRDSWNILVNDLFVQTQLESVEFSHLQPITTPESMSLFYDQGYIISNKYKLVPQPINNRQ